MMAATKRRKLVVLSVDALVTEDLLLAQQLPGFARIMQQGCGVQRVMSLFPTLTYPIHVVQVTGRHMKDTGVYNNEVFQPGRLEPDWCWDVSHIKVPTIFDVAHEAGLKTCAIMWPVLSRADIDFNIPEVWNMDDWSDPCAFYRDYCSELAFPYFVKHVGKLGWHPKPAYDEFAVALAEDILRNEAPDISFIHVSAVDLARHFNGVFCKEVNAAIKRVDGWITTLIRAIEAAGNWDETDFVVCSDHGHLMITRELNLNVLFKDNGLISLDANGNVIDYLAYCHSASLSGQILLKDPADKQLYGRVYALLLKLKAHKAYGIREIYTREAAEELFGLSGPFSFVVEGEEGTCFGHACSGRVITLPTDDAYTYVTTGHGHRPDIGPQPVFLATGPDFRQNAMLETCSILDELPTYLQILGMKMNNLEGRILQDLLVSCSSL